MEKLLELAKKACDQAEVYSEEYAFDELSFEDNKLKEIKGSSQVGVSLRIIKEGKLGFAYTKNLMDRQELVNQALSSLQGAVRVDYQFPSNTFKAEDKKSANKILTLSNKVLLNEGKRLIEFFQSRVKAELGGSVHKLCAVDRIINSNGLEAERAWSEYAFYIRLIYPGGYTCVGRPYIGKVFKEYPKERLEWLASMYKAGEKLVSPKSGKMPVLFMPNSIYWLAQSLKWGLSAKSIYEGTSPVSEKLEQLMLSERFTFYNDPLDSEDPGRREFDDEGVKTRRLLLYQNGILKNFVSDLHYASKLGWSSNGNGFRQGGWGNELISVQPMPGILHARIEPGEKTFSELVKSIKQGVILYNPMGAHCGNFLNGDFSFGVSPAYYVEDGEIQGRISDAIIAGNAYQALNNIEAIENKSYWSGRGKFPSVLCNDLSVSVRE